MKQNYKSIKCFSTSMVKVEFIRNHMRELGIHLNKTQALDAALTQFTKMLIKMKDKNDVTR